MKVLLLTLLALWGFSGCASKNQSIETIYIEKECKRAEDVAPAKWLPVKWVEIEIEGVIFIATPDTQILLGNLIKLSK